MINRAVIGAGGGGKGGGGSARTPTTTEDNLNSTQFAQLIDLISEGEIQGLKDGFKSIFFDNTPLQNADNSYNFKDVTVHARNGGQGQDAIPFAEAIQNEIPVGVTVPKSLPVTRTITSPNVDAVRITLTFPQFQKIQSDGDIVGAEVELAIDVQYSGGGFTTVKTDTIKGRSGDQYQKDYEIALSGARPAEVRVRRITSDSSSSFLTNEFTWTSYTEITYAKLRYPNSALIGLRINAEQFSNIPRRSYLVRGIKIRVPVNATVNTTTGSLTYSGVWNGQLSAATWCSDPAWVLYDLLTSKRYGLGDHVDEAQLDKWSFYAASQYCSALNTYNTSAEIAARAAKGLGPRTGTTDDYHPTTGRHGVPNGFGGYEPRFSCNVNIQTAEEAYKLINDMSSVFRSMPYWSTGALTVSQDKPADSCYLFSLANVEDGGFTYQSSSQKTRPTVAVVSYLDLTLRDIAYEVVEDAEAIAKYGVVTTQISAFACTSRGQANRVGRWILYSEKYESEVVSFTVSVDAGVVVRPGQVIEIADPMRAGQRRGGRITSATTQQIQVDSAEGLSAGNNRTLSVILADGTVEVRNVTSISGRLVTVSSPFSSAPATGGVWLYQTSDIQSSTWRVLSVQEQDGCRYLVNALSYDAGKFNYVDLDTPLQPRDTTNLNEIPAAPTNLQLTEALYSYQGNVRAKVIASWRPVTGMPQYQVRWRKDSGNWTVVTRQAADFEVLDITPGLFEFQVFSLSAAGRSSVDPLTGSIAALGKTAPPGNVTGFAYSIDPFIGVTLAWDPVQDIDVDLYEIRVGSAWGTATLLTQVKASSFKVGYLDDGTQTYLIKAVDTSGVYSATATSLVVTISVPNPVVVTHQVKDPVVVLEWSPPAVTSYAIDYYRVTYGATYASSTELTQTKSTSFSVPVTWSGARTFWVVPVDLVGNTSATQGSTSPSITPAPAPAVSGVVAGTTATISWSAVNGTLATAGYQIRSGATFATATILASITGTSYTLRANWAGTSTFWVAAVDGNGNVGTGGSVALTVSAAPAPAILSTFTGRDVVLSWTAVKGTLDTDVYVIKRGASFETATTIATTYGTTHTLRVDWVGTQVFWVAAVDINGLVGAAGSDDVIVLPPATPSITQQVVDNNVLLRWNDVTTTLPIEFYELRKGATLVASTSIGSKQGGFTTVFENQSGTYTYWLAGVDSAGNVGTAGSVSALVNQPPDYALQLDQNSTWAGTEVNIYTDSVLGQIVNANTTETWQSHFTSRGYSSPQDQVNAGFTYYLMPTATSASYEEEFDYGALLTGTKITATLTAADVAGATTIAPTIRVRGTATTAGTYSQSGTTTITVTSTAHGLVANDLVWLDFTSGTAADGSYVVGSATANTFTVTAASAATTSGNVSWVKWLTYPGITELYATSFRYFRIRYDFTSAGGNDIMVLSSLNVRLDAKIRNAAGTGTANAADTGGTVVNFGISFIDVQSITVTPSSTAAVFAVYDFVDVPNPTSFKVLLFDTAGARVSGPFSWTARGV